MKYAVIAFNRIRRLAAEFQNDEQSDLQRAVAKRNWCGVLNRGNIEEIYSILPSNEAVKWINSYLRRGLLLILRR